MLILVGLIGERGLGRNQQQGVRFWPKADLPTICEE